MVHIKTDKLKEFVKALENMSPSHRDAVCDFIHDILSQKKANEDLITKLLLEDKHDLFEEKTEDTEKDKTEVYGDEEYET